MSSSGTAERPVRLMAVTSKHCHCFDRLNEQLIEKKICRLSDDEINARSEQKPVAQWCLAQTVTSLWPRANEY